MKKEKDTLESDVSSSIQIIVIDKGVATINVVDPMAVLLCVVTPSDEEPDTCHKEIILYGTPEVLLDGVQDIHNSVKAQVMKHVMDSVLKTPTTHDKKESVTKETTKDACSEKGSKESAKAKDKSACDSCPARDFCDLPINTTLHGTKSK